MLNLGAPSTKSLIIPSPQINAAGTYSTPLIAIGGGLLVLANTLNQALTVAAPAGEFAFITDMFITCLSTGAVQATISLLDSSGGTTLDLMATPATGPTLNMTMARRFTIPLRNLTAGGQFFISSGGVGVTWAIQVNGFYTNIL